MAADEPAALGRKQAQTRPADAKELVKALDGRFVACQYRVQRRGWRRSDRFKSGPDLRPVSPPDFDGLLARLLPSDLVILICGQVRVVSVAQSFFTRPDRPERLLVALGLALAGGRNRDQKARYRLRLARSDRKHNVCITLNGKGS